MMTTTFKHLINHRVLTTFLLLEKELKLHPQKNYLFDLSYLGVLDVEGDKAIEFLQGQLTCDVRLLSDTQMLQGAQCNLKGRILALMDIISWQGVKLILPNDLLEATIKSLNTTALLSRVSFKIDTTLRFFGFYLQNPDDLVLDTTTFPDTLYAQTTNLHACCYHLGHGFYIFLAQSEFADSIQQQFQAKEQLLGSLTWHTLRLTQQQIDIYPESRGLFLPHRLNLHQTKYISFNKGCYKGQEIIARMHYKATLKHQLSIYELKTDQKIHCGQKIHKSLEGTELGELVDFSLLGRDHYVIAVSMLKDSGHTVLFDGHNKTVELKEYQPV